MKKKPSDATINVRGKEIAVIHHEDDNFISLTDMVRNFDGSSALIEQWLKNKDTVLFLGVWEQLNNPDFNSLEFEGIKNEAGRNSFSTAKSEMAYKWLIRIAPEMTESRQSPRHPLHLRSARTVRNRQITMIRGAANPVELDGVDLRIRNTCRVYENSGFSRSERDRFRANGICKEQGISCPRQSLMAGLETRPTERETDNALKKILEKIGI